MMEERYMDTAVEALILASPEPLAGRRISKLVEGGSPSKIARSVALLNDGYSERGSSFRIREIAGGYQYYILPEYAGFVEEMFSSRRKLRLTRAALEAVAIVAYRQPVTKTEVEHIRGVASDGVLRTLLEKNLITVTGRAATVGKPLQYGTTDEFLKFFGLGTLDGLPKMSEIEEMISASESRNQTELELELDADRKIVKLNVADGTYDPERRERLDEEPELDPDPESEKQESVGDRLVLVRPEPEEIEDGGAEKSADNEGVVAEPATVGSSQKDD
ncbi:MAG: SMC-Scp complex subunit ScpB [bacterium]|nr:SMC-Scp complex subunit ScpB [bacterium]